MRQILSGHLQQFSYFWVQWPQEIYGICGNKEGTIKTKQKLLT